MLKLRYDDTNDLHRPYTTVAQALCKHIGVIIMLPGIFLYLLALLSTDARTVLQRPETVATETPNASAIFFIVMGTICDIYCSFLGNQRGSLHTLHIAPCKIKEKQLFQPLSPHIKLI